MFEILTTTYMDKADEYFQRPSSASSETADRCWNKR